MAVIAPCITADSPEAYRESIERLMPFASRVHIDISDGSFAPNTLVPVESLYWPANWQVDVHIMSHQPAQYLPFLISMKPHAVILHAEAEEDIMPSLQQLKQYGIKAGVALLKSTVPKLVAPLIEAAEHIMIFSGNLGEYGGVASMMQLEKVRLIKAINRGAEIGWDGGAAADNVFSLAQGSVDVVNSGGAINNAEDPKEAFDKMVTEINKQGVL